MTRVQRLTKAVRKIDPDLYVIRIPTGMLQVHRRSDRLRASDYGQRESLNPAWMNPKFILALTHNWTLKGYPVDWGIEPVMQKLRDMDAWSHDVYSEVVSERESRDYWEKRSNLNEFKAAASEARSGFAKALNDVNTSTMEMVDGRRRIENGNC